MNGLIADEYVDIAGLTGFATVSIIWFLLLTDYSYCYICVCID